MASTGNDLIYRTQSKCFTCMTNLANKQIQYEEKMNNISNNIELSFKEIDIAKRNVFNDLGLNFCCRMRIMNRFI